MVKSSLRLQFLIPMLSAMLLIALVVMSCSKWFADRSARQAVLERLSSTGKLCVNAPYPLTAGVLTQIQELSSLRLAIIAETPDFFRLETSSKDFPSRLDLIVFAPHIAKLRTQEGKPFYLPIEIEGEQPWNATAFALPQSADTSVPRFLVLMEPQSRSNEATQQAFWLPLITGLFSSLAIALVATWVAARIGRRIELLETHVQKIASGAFDSIAPIGPNDVIRSLYDSINSMSRQLQSLTIQIAQDERSRLINLIASGLAHDMRNQLTGAKLAIQTCRGDDSSREALAIALNQMHLAEESIQRLLSLRIDSSSSKSAPLPADKILHTVHELTQKIAEHQRVQYLLQPLHSEMESDADSSKILIDDGSGVVGALINLVLNAFEATGPGGTVSLQSRLVHSSNGALASSANVVWQVLDDGPGPTESIAVKMFEPFATTKREGVGLGLAMCKRIAQRLGGDVRWSRENGWTQFQLEVPIYTSEQSV